MKAKRETNVNVHDSALKIINNNYIRKFSLFPIYSISSITYIGGNVNIALLLTKLKKPIHRNTYKIKSFMFITRLCLLF